MSRTDQRQRPPGGRHRGGRARPRCARFLSYLPEQRRLQPAGRRQRASRPAPADDLLTHRARPAPSAATTCARCSRPSSTRESIFPWAERTGRSLVTSLARLDGQPVGVVANQPMMLAGVLDPAALAKEHAFADLCDTFNIPLVFLHDVPGLMIGTQGRARRRAAAGTRGSCRALANATVPKLGVILRKSYGGGNFAMGGRPTHPDLLVVLADAPSSGFMAPETGVRTVHRRRLDDVLAEPRARRPAPRWSRRWPRSGRTSPSRGRRRPTSTSTTSSARRTPAQVLITGPRLRLGDRPPAPPEPAD